MIYLPTKFEGDRLKNKEDIAEPIQVVKKNNNKNKKQTEKRKVFRFQRTT